MNGHQIAPDLKRPFVVLNLLHLGHLEQTLNPLTGELRFWRVLFFKGKLGQIHHRIEVARYRSFAKEPIGLILILARALHFQRLERKQSPTDCKFFEGNR